MQQSLIASMKCPLNAAHKDRPRGAAVQFRASHVRLIYGAYILFLFAKPNNISV
ncbi:hypothetical protein D3C71_2014320 [compost metagenome]